MSAIDRLDEIMDDINAETYTAMALIDIDKYYDALSAVLEIHTPTEYPKEMRESLNPEIVNFLKRESCSCSHFYPCPTVLAINKVFGIARILK